MKTTLGFFGAGKMAEGILAAAACQTGFDPQTVLMAEKLPARAKELAKRYHVRTTPDAREVARAARVIFLAVRPQDLAALAADVKPFGEDARRLHRRRQVARHAPQAART